MTATPTNRGEFEMAEIGRAAALHYWRNKLKRPLFPCRPLEKRPAVKWSEEATTDRDALNTWLADPQSFNFAVALGGGVIAIDCDSQAARDEFEQRFGKANTLTVRTPRPGGAWHFYFRKPSGIEVRNSAGKLGENIDVRGDGGYTLVPRP
jgi:putative DNA primase/helicase